MKTYDPSKVNLSLRTHTKECNIHKSTFTRWVETSLEDMPKANRYIEGSGYGDFWNIFYKDNKLVGKGVHSQGETSYYKFIRNGVGEKYECDCEMPYTKIEGFARDSPITIKREEL